MQRAIYFLMPVAILAGCGPKNESGGTGAAAPPPTTMAPAAMPSPTMVAADQMTIKAELVKMDTAAKTVTVRDITPAGGGANTAAEKMLTVEDVSGLSGVKAGDQVALTCRTTMSVPVVASPAPGAAAGAATAPTGTTAAMDATMMASVNSCNSVISVAAASATPTTAGAMTPAGGTASPSTGR